MRYSRLRSRHLFAALVSGAVVLAIPVVVSATPSIPLQTAHLLHAGSIQKAGHSWHHRYSHRWYSHRWYSHYRRGIGITADPSTADPSDPPPVRLYHT